MSAAHLCGRVRPSAGKVRTMARRGLCECGSAGPYIGPHRTLALRGDCAEKGSRFASLRLARVSRAAAMLASCSIGRRQSERRPWLLRWQSAL
jgi:hypothetical protein